MTAARTAPAVAPWTRTRLLASRGAALALTLLVAATTLLAAAAPRSYDRYQDTALHDLLARGTVSSRAVEGQADLTGQSQLTGAAAPTINPSALVQLHAALAALLASFRLDTEQGSTGVHTLGQEDTLTDPGLPAPEAENPSMVLAWQDGAAAQLHLASGRMPRQLTEQPAGLPGGWHALEIAVSSETAQVLHLHLGQTLHLSPQQAPFKAQLTVVGVYQPLPSAADFWNAEARLIRPVLTGPPQPKKDPHRFWHAEALVAVDDVPMLADLGHPEAYWWLPLAPAQLTSTRIQPLQKHLDSLLKGDGAFEAQNLSGVPGGVALSSDLPSTLDRFTAHSEALTPLLTIGLVGTAGVAASVLLMAAGLSADRRDGELRLLRARGAGLRGLLRRVLLETLACTTPGALLGLVSALLLLPTERWMPSVQLAALLWVAATLSVPVRSLARHRRVRATGRDTDLLTARPSRRRTVTELGVLVATLAAVTAVRRQGLGAGGFNPLLGGAPLLLGVAGAILLVRLYPWPLRLVTRPMERRGGAIGFLGLARAGRGASAASLLPLLALLLALTVAVFGSEVITGVDRAREGAALSQVGADAAVTALGNTLPPSLITAVRAAPGVRAVLPVSMDSATLDNNGSQLTVYSFDPDRYRTMAGKLAGEDFPAALLHPSADGAVTALASPDMAESAADGTLKVTDAFGSFQVRVVGTKDSSMLAPGGSFLLVSAQALARVPRATASHAGDPTELLVQGPVTRAALQAALVRSGGAALVEVALRSEALAQLQQDPQQDGAVRLYLGTVLAAALLCVLAVLLSLLQAAPGRASLLARLRTMGLTSRQGYRLILVEALPQVVVGVLGGTALGLAAIPLLGSSVDLAALAGTTGGPGGAGLRAEALPLLAPGLGLLMATVAVVAVEAAVTGRRQIATELRAGDAR